MSVWWVMAVTAAFSGGARAAGPVTFYVSPAGSDAWSGQLPEPNRLPADGHVVGHQGTSGSGFDVVRVICRPQAVDQDGAHRGRRREHAGRVGQPLTVE